MQFVRWRTLTLFRLPSHPRATNKTVDGIRAGMANSRSRAEFRETSMSAPDRPFRAATGRNLPVGAPVGRDALKYRPASW